MNIFKSLFSNSNTTVNSEEETKSDEINDMISGLVELAKTSVKDVYVPRIDVTFMSEDITLKETIELMEETGHSRFPVFRETMDEIIGILYVKDLLIYLNKLEDESKFNITDVIRNPSFVPESKKLDSLLKEFKKLHVHIAIAVDEYGGVSGIVSMEDIIEEILGDIQDEFDNEPEDIIKIDDNTWLCDARADIDDINDLLELDIDSSEIETIGGYVFNLIGEIPVKFEKVDTEHLTIVIVDVDGHRIKRVKLVKKDV